MWQKSEIYLVTIFFFLDGIYLNTDPANILTEGKSVLESTFIKSGPTGQCIQFWYNTNGKIPGTFNVKLVFNDTEYVVWSTSENKGGQLFFNFIVLIYQYLKNSAILLMIQIFHGWAVLL